MTPSTALLLLSLSAPLQPPPGPPQWTLPPMVERVADAYLIPRHLAKRQAFAESSWWPLAVSKKGARGLFQIRKKHEAELVWRAGLRRFDWRDPVQSAVVGLSYTARLRKHYWGDLQLTYAAYNWGPGNIDRAYWKARARQQWAEENGRPPEPLGDAEFWPCETREYVRVILGP